MTKSTGVCAVVVTYFPDAGLKDRLGFVLPQVDALVVVDNTPSGASDGVLEALLPPDEHICLIRNCANSGVAAALNQGLAQALGKDCGWLLTLDQDSVCHPDMVQTLLGVRDVCVPFPRVIGSNYIDARNQKTRVAAGGEGEFLEQKTVITSGSLVDLKFASAIGGFREDFFIDQVDHEFCLRVRAHAGRVVICRKPVMEHSVGEAGGAWLPLLGYLPNHGPLRKYYLARNSLVLIDAFWRKEPDWCVRRAIRLLLGLPAMLLVERNGWKKARAFFLGIIDYWRGQMGPCSRPWLCG